MLSTVPSPPLSENDVLAALAPEGGRQGHVDDVTDTAVRIMLAAADAFAEHGFPSTTTRDIASRAAKEACDDGRDPFFLQRERQGLSFPETQPEVLHEPGADARRPDLFNGQSALPDPVLDEHPVWTRPAGNAFGLYRSWKESRPLKIGEEDVQKLCLREQDQGGGIEDQHAYNV